MSHVIAQCEPSDTPITDCSQHLQKSFSGTHGKVSSRMANDVSVPMSIISKHEAYSNPARVGIRVYVWNVRNASGIREANDDRSRGTVEVRRFW